MNYEEAVYLAMTIMILPGIIVAAKFILDLCLKNKDQKNEDQ